MPCTREGIATLGRGTTVCFVRTKCSIYIQYVMGMWFRWSMCSQLRLNISNYSDIVLNSKAKREEVHKIRQVYPPTNTNTGIFLQPHVSCLFFIFFKLNPETECCNTFDSSECTCVADSGDRASVCHVNTKPRLGGKTSSSDSPQLLTSVCTESRVAT